MITPQTIAEVIAKLEKLAAQRSHSDRENFCAMDDAGGNFDDAFQYGINDGETFLARELLVLLGLKPTEQVTVGGATPIKGA